MAADEGQGKAGRKAAWQPMGASGQDCMVADGSAQSASSKADNSKARSRIEGTTPHSCAQYLMQKARHRMSSVPGLQNQAAHMTRFLGPCDSIRRIPYSRIVWQLAQSSGERLAVRWFSGRSSSEPDSMASMIAWGRSGAWNSMPYVMS